MLRAALTLAVASGCASVGSTQRADTLGTGNLQVGLEPGAQVYAGGRGAAPAPHVDASIRIGVAERVDLGLRIGLLWVEAQGKVLLTEPRAPRLAISLAPSFGGTFVPVNGTLVKLLHGSLPLLIGVKFGGRHELVFGPRLMLYASLDPTAGGTLLSPALSIGIAFKLTETFGLMPEIAAGFPVVQIAGAQIMTSQGPVTSIFQFKLGLLIGRQRT